MQPKVFHRSLCVVLMCAVARIALAEEGETGPRYRIAYATYLGGSAWDQAREIILLPDGSVLVGAQSSSSDMPTTEGVVQPRYAGDDPALGHGGVYGGDLYLAVLSPDGASLRRATYFGGSRQERNVYGMELDPGGDLVLATMTRSSDAPTTPGCFQPKYGGGPSDMLVAKLSLDLGRRLWCTYVGGKGDDSPRGGITLDDEGNVVVVGTSSSEDFPTTEGVLQRALRGPRDSALVKVKADGSGLVFGTLLGGTGEDDAIMGAELNEKGEIFIAGHTRSTDFPVTSDAAQARHGGGSDAYIARLSSDASDLVYATYLGGRLHEFAEHKPRLEDFGTLLLTGFTASPDFPTTRWAAQRDLKGNGDGFVTRVSRDGEHFVLSTFLGGSGSDNWLMPTVDADGFIYVVGSTSSTDLPVTADAQQRKPGGGEDGAIVVLSPDGSRVHYASYLGGSGDEIIRSIALGPGGDIYVVGSTSSDDFPATPGAFQSRHRGAGDAFVAKLEGLPRYPEGEWVSLFDGKSLSRWHAMVDEDYPTMYGKVAVADGAIVLEAGGPMTGIAWTGHVPRCDYEVELEGQRVTGGDFFCGLTLPVDDQHVTWILGGWGGSVVGLSNIDSYSAVENQTTTGKEFENGRWYSLRARVTKQKIEAWIDGESVIDFERAGHQLDIWPQQEPGRPLGITSYYTKSALRNIRVRVLPADR